MSQLGVTPERVVGVLESKLESLGTTTQDRDGEPLPLSEGLGTTGVHIVPLSFRGRALTTSTFYSTVPVKN